ncbi:MAG: RsmE family RNA methyltransferase [Phycisphaerales bacterium]
MSQPWFHLAALPAPGEFAALDRDEAKHALGARRLGAGDGVVLFDGAGALAQARLEGGRDRQGGVLARVESVERRGAIEPAVLLGVAIPKGDRFGTLLDMAAQLAAAAIVPLETDYGVKDPERLNRARAQRILLEGCKQSRNAWLPRLEEPMRLEAFVARARARGLPALVAHPGGAPLRAAAAGAREVAIAIGPEGGFSESEMRAAQGAGATAVTLGPTILRIEAAATAALAALRVP